MGVGSAFGEVMGGLLVSFAPATVLKLLLGALLAWSAREVLTKHG
jgi:hypothetical protein